MNTLLILFIFIPILALILIALNLLLAIHKPDTEKLSIYECGYVPVEGQTRKPIDLNYITVAMLFLIFDSEILVSYPLAVTLYQISFYGFAIFLLFFIVLTVGFAYELGKGVLKFSEHKTKILNQNNIKK